MSRGPDPLSIARGDARDGVAAIEHFREVLVSRRVGPRMLAQALPEMAAGCGPLRAALDALGGALCEKIAGDAEGVAAVRGLIAHAVRCVDELDAALAAHKGSAVDARVRLALEAVVRRVTRDLGATLSLTGLLAAPITSETITIDFADALAARRAAPASPAGKRAVAAPTEVLAAVEIRTAELAVSDAQLLLDLLDHAVATVARAGVRSPRVVVETGPEGFPLFTVEAAAITMVGSNAPTFRAPLREELPHEAAVVRAAARHAGLRMTVAEDGRRVTIAY